MSYTEKFDNYLGKLVLNTTNSRIEGSQYVWDDIRLPIINMSAKSLLDIESCYKSGGTSNNTQRTYAFTTTSRMSTSYDYSNIYTFYPSYAFGNINRRPDYIYFSTSNNSPIYRFRFKENIAVAATYAELNEPLAQSTDGINWSTASTFPMNTPITVFDHFLNYLDLYRNNIGSIQATRFYFADNSYALFNGEGNSYTSVFSEYQRYTYIHFYIPSLGIIARWTFSNSTNTTGRTGAIAYSLDGGLTWIGGFGPIPTNTNYSSPTIPCDCFIIQKTVFPISWFRNGTIINIETLSQPTTYDSSTGDNTRQVLTLQSGLATSGSMKPHSPNYETVAMPLMYNLNSTSCYLKLNVNSTSDPTKQLYLPYGDAIQLTCKVFEEK